jgi:hypothetical protein
MDWIEILVIIIFVVFILLLFYKTGGCNCKENFFLKNANINNVSFMTKGETSQFLESNWDNYYDTFSIYDLEARKVRDLDTYISKIKESTSDFSEEQKERLRKLAKKADLKISKINKPWLNGDILSKMSWRFGYTINGDYEGGLPHTRGDKDVDVIMLGDKLLNNDNDYLTGTLIHEKVHLYQRKFPQDVEKYKDEKRLRRWKRRDKNDMVRANPDIDEYIYKNEKNETLMSKYKDETPTGLEDVITTPEDGQKNEHPNEMMAIEIEEMAIGK